ncbi:putative signal transducing protein [Granulicella paludicola]|jgi:hypothetical protein|uniref:hypothetical protein n=1 Tax=Granulicella paludicola TaxID=474951 RepID=UPI0021E02CBC|nr:hypothetical protein [Granulicella paludicola]
MALDRELANFLDVYNDRSDAELLALHEHRDDLTDLAQQALAQVIKERGLSVTGVPVTQPLPDHSAIADEALDADEVELQTFDDAFRLNEALRLLTQAEIPHRVVNWDAIEPRSTGSRGLLQLGLIVGREDEAQARKLLQAAMKLFPQAEGNDPAEDPKGMTLLGVMSRINALIVAHALGSSGISYAWTDGRDDMTLEEQEIRLEVHAQRLEEAQILTEQTLA